MLAFYRVMHWPKSKTLCFPVFLENKPHPPITDTPLTLEQSQMTCTSPPPEVMSTLPPSSQPGEDSPLTDNCQSTTRLESCLPQPQDTSYPATLPLMGDNLPKEREALLELEYQTAAELVWIKQAISSRQKVCCVCVYCCERPLVPCIVLFCSIFS